MNPRSLAPLASTPFAAALALLVANDLLLKAAYGNWFTGKLSDFAGLFATGFFCTVVWARGRLLVPVAIAAAFVFWKSPLSTPLVAWLSLYVPVGRTIDFTDLAALPAIWFGSAVVSRARPWTVPRSVPVGIALVSLVAFTATSMVRGMARQTVELERAVGVSSTDQQVALTRSLDEFARRHKLDCLVCEDITQGRVYGSDDGYLLTATFDAPEQFLFLNASSQRSGNKAFARVNDLLEELRGRLQENPAATGVRNVSMYGSEDIRHVGVLVQLDLDANSLQPAPLEASRRVVSQIIEEVVRKHGLQAGENSFFTGRRFGPREYDREFLLLVVHANVPLVRVTITRVTNEHESLQRAVVADLEARLRSAFPAGRVNTSW